MESSGFFYVRFCLIKIRNYTDIPMWESICNLGLFLLLL